MWILTGAILLQRDMQEDAPAGGILKSTPHPAVHAVAPLIYFLTSQ